MWWKGFLEDDCMPPLFCSSNRRRLELASVPCGGTVNHSIFQGGAVQGDVDRIRTVKRHPPFTRYSTRRTVNYLSESEKTSLSTVLTAHPHMVAGLCLAYALVLIFFYHLVILLVLSFNFGSVCWQISLCIKTLLRNATKCCQDVFLADKIVVTPAESSMRSQQFGILDYQ